jgi:hypothetical protein
MIDRKNREMQELAVKVKEEEQEFQDTERRLEELSEEYKHRSVQCEADLAAARMAAETATSKRMELEKRFKLSTQEVAAMRRTIRRNEQNIETYRRYRTFMEMVEQTALVKLTSDPSDLMNVFAMMESDNLFLMHRYNELKNNASGRVAPLNASIGKTDRTIDELQKKQKTVEFVKESRECLTDDDYRAAQAIEKEFERIDRLVRSAYVACFHRPADTSAMGLLEHIENSLEAMYQALETVSPAFVQKKQKKQDEERLEKRRLDTAARKAADQRAKIDQAVERARMPIKRRTGRPMIQRVLPIVVRPVDEEKLRAERRERRRIEALLYEDEDA